MIISSQQMAAMQRLGTRHFEDRTFEHVAQYFPDLVELCGEPGVRQAIRQAWQRASTFAVTSERGVLQFVDVCLVLGAGFDSDPRVPWASHCLRNDQNSPETSRMESLFRQAIAFIDATRKDFPAWGGDPNSLTTGMRQLRAESADALSPSDLPAFRSRLASLLRRCLPARCNYVGAENLNNVFDAGIRGAREHGLMTHRGAAVYTTFVFLLGTGVAADPLYDWVAAALAPAVPAVERADRLFDSGVARMRKWLA